MQTFFVAVIVGLAAAYCIRKVYQSFKTSNGTACGCGCSECGQVGGCEPSTPADKGQ
jgi:hypothetical protein